MNILLVHNYYRKRGGEDEVFAAEGVMLETHGHRVSQFTMHNDQMVTMGKLHLAQATLWNSKVYHELRTLIRKERPQVVHFHNIFPLVSPAAYYAARAEKVPIVQTLHNWRLMCPAGSFFRDRHICEDCLGKFVPWPGVLHACYHTSRLVTGTVAALTTMHRALGTWMHQVDLYVALTEFARQKFIQGYLPAERVVVKPHFVHPDPGAGSGRGRYALFVGRLFPEKGVQSLLEAWQHLRGRIPLKIVGDGPLRDRVAKAVLELPMVEWLGRRSLQEVYALMGEAALVVWPTENYETFGRVVIEAFAKGTPVIASKVGGIAELVDSGRTGRYFRPGDPVDLAAQVEWALTHPRELAGMRREARIEFERRYTAERNYSMLTEIYDLARSCSRTGHARDL